MQPIYPSQVVTFVEGRFRRLKREQELKIAYEGPLRALSAMMDAVPQHLLTFTGDAVVESFLARAEIELALARWTRGETAARLGLVSIGPSHAKRNPVTIIRDLFETLADEAPTPTTSDLAFVEDDGLREALRLDLASVDASMGAGHWKAATVVAGSIAEALLLESLERRHDENKLKDVHGSVCPNARRRPPDQWHFAEYAEVARGLQHIDEHTRVQCRQANEFRNLIHPGREQRLKVTCDRATALAALAAVYLVIRDLSRGVDDA